MQRLESEVGGHRSRAVAMLSECVSKLAALHRLSGDTELAAMIDEYREFIRALEKLDPRQADDPAWGQLTGIEVRLEQYIEILREYRTDQGRPSRDRMELLR